MTTNQLFFALAGLLVTLFGMFGGFVKYYVDAKISGVDGKISGVDGKISGLVAKIDARIDSVDGKIVSLRQQVDRLIDYMILHEGKIATLEEKTKKL